jgi:hypothetical protein
MKVIKACMNDNSAKKTAEHYSKLLERWEVHRRVPSPHAVKISCYPVINNRFLSIFKPLVASTFVNVALARSYGHSKAAPNDKYLDDRSLNEGRQL